MKKGIILLLFEITFSVFIFSQSNHSGKASLNTLNSGESYIPDTVYVKSQNGAYRKIYKYINDTLITYLQRENLSGFEYKPNARFEYFYDATLKLDSILYYDDSDSSTLSLKKRTCYIYDEAGLLNKLIFKYVNSFSETIYSYNEQGIKTFEESYKTANNLKTKFYDRYFDYDTSNRITKVHSIYTDREDIREYSYNDTENSSTSFEYKIVNGLSKPHAKYVHYRDAKGRQILSYGYKYNDTTEVAAYKYSKSYN